MIYKTLADMDFSTMLFESKAQTQSGEQLLNNYQSHVMANPVTCRLINNFMKEAKQCLYDSGVKAVYEKVAEIISSNKHSWMLASVCEDINSSKAGYNYLNMNAAKQVEKLLEMEEKDVVNYIKAGALKNVMFVEGFRNIVRNVQSERPIVEYNEDYTNEHPISLVEKANDGTVWFTAFGNLYRMNESGNPEVSADWKAVSEDFHIVNQMIQNRQITFANEQAIFKTPHHIYTISEQGKCVREDKEGKKLELTVEQLRDQNKLYVSTIASLSTRKQMSYMLESLARVCENFDRIGVMDNVHVVSTCNDRFAIVEGKTKTSAWSIQSNHAGRWSVNDNICEVCNVIKKRTNVDLVPCFKEKIEEAVKDMEDSEKEKIQESLQTDSLKSRREKIEALTEKYKNDPVRLAVLAKVAAELSSL